jgi:hypothetical protein
VQFGLLFGRELGPAASQPSLGTGNCHPLPRPQPQQVNFELSERGQDVEKHLAHRVGGVVDLPAERGLDAAGTQVVPDGPGVGHRPCEPVQFRHDQGVAITIACNLTADPELHNVAGGKAIARFSIAENRRRSDRSGAAQEAVTYLDVAAWGPMAAHVATSLHTGDRVLVTGRL